MEKKLDLQGEEKVQVKIKEDKEEDENDAVEIARAHDPFFDKPKIWPTSISWC